MLERKVEPNSTKNLSVSSTILLSCSRYSLTGERLGSITCGDDPVCLAAASPNHFIVVHASGLVYKGNRNTMKIGWKNEFNTDVRGPSVDDSGRVWIPANHSTKVYLLSVDGE